MTQEQAQDKGYRPAANHPCMWRATIIDSTSPWQSKISLFVIP